MGKEMKVVLGPFQQREEDSQTVHHGPTGTVATLDLRDAGHTKSVGLFIVPKAFNSLSYATISPDVATGEVPLSSRQLLKDELDLRSVPTVKTLSPLLFELLTTHADPDKGGGRNPLIPNSKGEYAVHFGTVKAMTRWDARRFALHWGKIQKVLRASYAQIKSRDEVLASKWASAMRRKLGVSFSAIADPGDREIPPTTIFTESFNQPDSTILGPDLTWTETQGNLETENNEVRRRDPATSIGRAEHDVSSDDHYAQIKWVAGEAGVACRYDAANQNFYASDYNNASGTFRIIRTSGTPTVLNSVVDSHAVPFALRVEADGSTIRCLADGVEKISLTDTAHVGYTRGGLRFGGGSFADDFVVEDLVSFVPAAYRYYHHLLAGAN